MQFPLSSTLALAAAPFLLFSATTASNLLEVPTDITTDPSVLWVAQPTLESRGDKVMDPSSPSHHTHCHLERDTGAFNTTTLQRNLAAYHSVFGGGAGHLNHGKDTSPTFQAVCCDDWCLYVKRSYEGKNQEGAWTDNDFNAAVERLKEWGPGRGGCYTDMMEQEGRLQLSFFPEDWKVWLKSDHRDGRMVMVGDEFGDTCASGKGYRGPSD